MVEFCKSTETTYLPWLVKVLDDNANKVCSKLNQGIEKDNVLH